MARSNSGAEIGAAALPSVSVLMYVKNGVETIEDAIKSVITQDYPNYEFIIVDAVSTDGTMDIVRKYAKHFAHIVSEPDRGPYDAANKAIALARNEVVILLMADDWFEPGALADIAASFAADPDCDLVTSGVRVVEARSEGGFKTVVELGGSANALTLGNILAVPYSLTRHYRRRLLDRVGDFSGEFYNGHDREMLIRIIASGVRSRIVERPVYVHRRHAGSNTLVFKRETYRRIYDEHVRMAERYRAHPGLGDGDQRMLADWEVEQYARWVLLELGGGAILRAVKIALSAGLYRPAAIASLWCRWQAILARRRLLSEKATD